MLSLKIAMTGGLIFAVAQTIISKFDYPGYIIGGVIVVLYVGGIVALIGGLLWSIWA